MIEKIVKLLSCYKGKLVDSNFVYGLVNVVVDNNDLNDYVQNININKKIIGGDKELGLMTAAEYYISDKIINLYTEGIIHYFNSIKKFFSNYNNEELIFCINLNVMLLIIHELEHAKQYKIASNDCNDFESKLIELGILNSTKLSEEDICFLYIYDPLERLADFYAYNICNMVAKKFIKEYPNVCSLMKFLQFNGLYDGYKDSMEFDRSPLEKYIDLSSDEINVKGIINFDKLKQKYDFYDRLKYGLPIEQDEYNELRIKLKNKGKILEYKNRFGKF